MTSSGFMPKREQASFQETLLPPAPKILPPTAFSVAASTPSLAATRSAIFSRASTPARRCDSQTLPIASWAEAQLIYAEAVGGQLGLDAINRVRAASSIAPLVMDPSDANAFETAVLEERRRQLFSEGQRYGDMLRKNLPFQTGTNRKGQTYSNLTCVPLPDVETLNNPNLGS